MTDEQEAGFARRRAEAGPEHRTEEAGFARRRAEAEPEHPSRPEDAFFSTRAVGGAPASLPPRPPRRASPFLSVPPGVAALALVFAGWLLWDFAPDVAFFFSSREPIDLGGPGAYRLDAARENRLAQIRGELVDAIPVTDARTGAPRAVGRIAGTNLVVDRPGRGGPPVFEGRLLPGRSRAGYAEAAAVMRARGGALPDGFHVLRDGERPRRKWIPVAGSVILALLAAVNLRALARRLLT